MQCRRLISEIYWQPIVNRANQVVGVEQLTRLAGFADSETELVFSVLGSRQINSITMQSLSILQETCSGLSSEKNKIGKTIFLNIEKDSFTSQSIVNEIIYTSNLLKNYSYDICIEVVERPLSNTNRISKYIDGLSKLKEAGIHIAMDDYDLNGPHIELKLGLCTLVKLDIRDIMIPSRTNGLVSAVNYYDKLRDDLYEFASLYKVNLLAEKVENKWQFELLMGMHFNYFQGYFFPGHMSRKCSATIISIG